ncbi:8-oxo-dGTP diphosphatase [Patescibacteria group bacterium]|nr:8-oxo-dGTP diphosphatase [Patescibacteria group bacterium]
MIDNSLCLLIKKDGNQIKEICLAMKKRGFGSGYWNGSGGKQEAQDKTIEDTLLRETQEEIGVKMTDFQKVGILDFYFKENPEWNQRMHIYLCDKWQGKPTETEEMKPQWFTVDQIPYGKMWLDDIYWLPKVLEGKLVKGQFSFAPGNKIIDHQLEVVTKI